MSRPFVSALILAAGESQRFPGFKLATKIMVDGKITSIIELLAEKYLSLSKIDETIIVLGSRPMDIIRETMYLDVKYVFNPDYAVDMSTSVKRGVMLVKNYADIVMIHPGDVPFVEKDTLRRVLDEALKLWHDGEDFVLIPTYKGRGAHPLVISRGLLGGIDDIGPETRGLKGFIARFRRCVRRLETGDPGTLYDIDTWDMLVKASRLFGFRIIGVKK